jgi:hypothetical protein
MRSENSPPADCSTYHHCHTHLNDGPKLPISLPGSPFCPTYRRRSVLLAAHQRTTSSTPATQSPPSPNSQRLHQALDAGVQDLRPLLAVAVRSAKRWASPSCCRSPAHAAAPFCSPPATQPHRSPDPPPHRHRPPNSICSKDSPRLRLALEAGVQILRPVLALAVRSG